MSAKETNLIIEKEDTIVIQAHTTLAQLAESEILQRHVKPISDAAQFLVRKSAEAPLAYKETSNTAANATIYQETFQGIRCTYRGTPGSSPCMREGGRECFAQLGGNSQHSILGGKPAGSPSCVNSCPLGIDIPGVLDRLREGNRLEAQRLLMKYAPFPQLTCLLCERCESACVQGDHGQSVGISKVFQTLGNDMEAHPHIFYAKPSGYSQKKLCIKGCGPLGLSAAFYLKKLGNQVSLWDVRTKKQIIDEFAEFASPFAAQKLSQYIESLQYMGVEFHFSKESLGHEDGIFSGGDFDQVLDGGEIVLGDQFRNIVESFLRQIRQGNERANRLNLEFGLKSYLEPGSTFLSFDKDGAEGSLQVLTSGLTGEDPRDWDLVLGEACRCLNCGCYGVGPSNFQTALTALDGEIKTNRRSIRALDFFSETEPLQGLEPDERIMEFEVPKCEDFISGTLFAEDCVRGADCAAQIAYAFLMKQGKILDARIVLGGIAPVPVRMIGVETLMRGKEATEDLIAQAMERACEPVVYMRENEGKVIEMTELLARALESVKTQSQE